MLAPSAPQCILKEHRLRPNTKKPRILLNVGFFYAFFLSLWELGPLYRIVTSIIFGIIALAASFLYARFKERIKGW